MDQAHRGGRAGVTGFRRSMTWASTLADRGRGGSMQGKQGGRQKGRQGLGFWGLAGALVCRNALMSHEG